MSDLTDHRRRADKLLAELEHAERDRAAERQRLADCRVALGHAKTAQAVLQAAAEGVQNLAHSQIAAVVTKALRTVGFDYDFEIEFRRSRGRTEARLWFVRDGNKLSPRDDAVSGGAVDVAALALRVAAILLSTPKRRPLIVADEPMKFVNGETYQGRVGQLIESLAADLGFQFVIATDDPWLNIGKVVEL